MLFKIGLSSGAFLFLAFAGWAHAQTSLLAPDRLRCEYRVNPLGVDSASPRFDWTLRSSDSAVRGQAQAAYEILVASSPEALSRNEGDLWDSGKVVSDAMSQISYAGKALVSDQPCWWKVRIWDASGTASAWSSAAQWTMGVLNDADWSGAQWIGAPGDAAKPDLKGPLPTNESVLLRREFTVKPGLKRAVVNVCGLGHYEMSLNGAKVGDDLLTPGWTQYEKTCLYDTYDITASLRPGANAAGFLLGNGMYLLHHGRFSSNTNMMKWYAPVQAIATIRLDYADGTTDTIVTDGQWHSHSGPITFSTGYGGEDFDARLEPSNWNTAHFDDSAWDPPQILHGPGGMLKGLACAAPPIRAFQSLSPVGQKVIRPGATVYDFGQNASVLVRMKVKGPAGSFVRVIPAELTHPNGMVDRGSVGGGEAWWQYTLKGDGDEIYEGKFFYQGARYFQVECDGAAAAGEIPQVESIEAVVIHADCPVAGQFSCSNDLFNRTWNLVRWAQQNNMVSIMTDCPAREKRGWLEQDHLNGPALRYNWDMAALFTKTTADMIAAQHANGVVPSTAPDSVHWSDAFGNSPEWGSACVLVPWQQYEFDGDVELLRRSYDMMQKYQAYLSTKAKDNIVAFGLCDWYDIGPRAPGQSQLTPIELTATAFYFEDTALLSKIATILDKPDDAARYAQQASDIRSAFNLTLFHADTNQYGKDTKMGSQCGNSITLVMDLAEPNNRAAVLENIVQNVHAKGLTAGDIGYRYLLRALTDGGRSDVVYALNNQSDKPGYGYMLKHGKTSLTEGWDGSSSQDHFMLGQINEWFYHDLAGIQCDPAGPGFRKILIKPAIVGDLAWVKASYDSISGTIVSEWKRDGQNVTLHVVIPVNTTATICIPTDSVDSVHESGKPMAQSTGVKFLSAKSGEVRYQVGSGTYDIAATLPSSSPP
jgi:alpha-L-rhamnosidase